jgi:hypothetical protein
VLTATSSSSGTVTNWTLASRVTRFSREATTLLLHQMTDRAPSLLLLISKNCGNCRRPLTWQSVHQAFEIFGEFLKSGSETEVGSAATS